MENAPAYGSGPAHFRNRPGLASRSVLRRAWGRPQGPATAVCCRRRSWNEQCADSAGWIAEREHHGTAELKYSRKAQGQSTNSRDVRIRVLRTRKSRVFSIGRGMDRIPDT